MTTAGSRLHVRVFRALLHAYPAGFREAHARDMEQWFVARLSRARDPGAVLALWKHVIADTAANAIALRRQPTVRDSMPVYAGGFEMLWQDVRYAFRHLVRSPGFAIGAVLLLAIGIGANIAVFTVVDRVLIRPMPFERPHEVVFVYQDSDDGVPSSSAFPAYRDMAAATDVFRAVSATTPTNLSWERATSAVDVTAEFATASYVDVTGLRPRRGTWFSSEHDRVGGPFVAVVSAAAWQSRFGGDPDIVGKTVRLNGQTVTIIGVGPEELSGSYPPVITDFWLSISSVSVGGQFRVENLERRADHWYDVRARLAEGVTPEQAQAAMDALAARMGEMYPQFDRGRGIAVRPAGDVSLYPDSEAALLIASAIVATLLLLAGANLANLLLVRGIARSGEVAVRRALGASGLRVGRLYLIESLLLSVTGGVLGLLLARAALAALHQAPLPFPFSAVMDLSIDMRIGVFAVALMTLTGVLFGLAPALRSVRDNVSGVLREDRRTASVGRGTVRLRGGLVIVQMASSLVLVLVSGLLARSLVAMQTSDPGVDADRVAFVRTSPARAGLSGPDAAVLLEDLRTRIESLPGVTRAAIALRLPAQQSGTTTTVVEGYTPAAGTDAVELYSNAVSPEYFETMGLTRRDGRNFLPTDVAGAERVAIINESAARLFWGDGRALGRRLTSQGQPDFYRVVVGVVEDAPVVQFPERPARPMFYVPTGQSALGSAYVTARTDGEATAIVSSLRTAVTDVRSTLPVLAQGTLTSHFGETLAAPRFMVRVMAGVSVLALVLAALGIYAVVAFNVARRSTELGLRIALGASPRRVVGMVVRETIGSITIGLVAGLAIASLAVRRLDAVLFGIEPLDPLTFAGTALFLTFVAWAAAWLPARRAANADPAVTLRVS
jgi:putative ABC transport system permease protein